MLEKNITANEKFLLWEKYEIMDKRKNIVTTMIDNGILEQSITSFKEILKRYSDSCKEFLYKLFEFEGSLDNWNIDFINGKISFTKVDEFDLYKFVLNNLNLTPEFQGQIDVILKEVY